MFTWLSSCGNFNRKHTRSRSCGALSVGRQIETITPISLQITWKKSTGRLWDNLIGRVRQWEESSLTTDFQWDWWSVELMVYCASGTHVKCRWQWKYEFDIRERPVSDMDSLKDQLQAGSQGRVSSRDSTTETTCKCQPWRVPSAFNFSMCDRGLGARLREL